jgi:hypothetical protein
MPATKAARRSMRWRVCARPPTLIERPYRSSSRATSQHHEMTTSSMLGLRVGLCACGHSTEQIALPTRWLGGAVRSRGFSDDLPRYRTHFVRASEPSDVESHLA